MMARKASVRYASTILSVWAAVALSAVGAGSAPGQAELVSAPENPAFTQYLDNAVSGTVETATSEGHPLGLMPCPVDLSHTAGQSILPLPQAPDYPTVFDLRTQNKLTPVRNQGMCGSCWAFATYGSLESWLMPAESRDFSENNLKNKSGFDISCCNGGDHFMSTAYLARWGGPMNETDDPYTISCTSTSTTNVQKHVQSVTFIPDKLTAYDNANIKYAVYNYGAAYTTFYYTDECYNASTKSYYNGASAGRNHAVCIVGWDDNYDKSKFAGTPPGNGAFIAKNSWGAGWGEYGYFYVSYWDAEFGTDNALFQAEPTNNFTRVYQYDPYGWVGSAGYSSTTAWFANVFTASTSEALAGASWYAASAGSDYTVYIYLDPSSGPINPSGAVASKSGTIYSPGYQTVRLDSPVTLTAGHKFSVVVRLTTPGYNYPIAFEYPRPGYCSQATANPGESYVSSSGVSWSDLTTHYANANVCLKAFTTQAAALSVTPSSGLTSSGPSGGPFTPSGIDYTLANAGSESLNWTAAHLPSGSWISVSPSSGTLTGGGQATVHVTLNSGAAALSPGSYSDTVTFTNLTIGVGNTTRGVSLMVAGTGSIAVTPTAGMSSSGSAGGPFSPDRAQYTIQNTGGTAIDFTVTHETGQNWLTIYETIPAHESATATCLINPLAESLASGTYLDTVAFTNLTNGVGNTLRAVQLSVLGGAMSVTPADGLASSGLKGGPFSPTSKQYTITNTGAASIDWQASHNGGVNWISLDQTLGSLAPGGSTIVTVTINSNAGLLDAGTYNDTITFTNLTNGVGDTTRPVALTVQAGRLAVVPATGFVSSGAVGGPFSPTSTDYTLSNPGSASINWTASHLPGATWLGLSSESGTLSPGGSTIVTVFLNIYANLLPAGVYSDTVAFTNLTGGAGNTTRSVSLTVATRTLTSVNVIPATMGCPSIDPRQIHATAYFSDSTSQDITSTGTWTSSNTAVATLSSGGVVTPKVNGTATMTCSYTYGDVTRSDTCAVTVSFQALWYLYMVPSSYLFYQSTPAQFTCRARLASGWLTVTDQCQWTSGNPSIATIDQRGLVTPVANGSTTIRATYIYNGAPNSVQGSATVQLR